MLDCVPLAYEELITRTEEGVAQENTYDRRFKNA